MIGIAIILIFALYLAFLCPIFKPKDTETPHNTRYDMQMKKLWNAAQTSMRDHKPLRAEKALLTILKFDEKNAAAYNRLGILYAKEQKFDEAIECFEIAQSLDNNPSSLHNVGLIYLETGAFEKAVMAFEQAIEIEQDVPARFIALAKAQERLGRTKLAIEALENAYALDHSVSTLRQILAIHEASGDVEALASVTARIEAQITADSLQRSRARRKAQGTSERVRAPRKTAKAPRPTKAVARPTKTVVRTSKPTMRTSKPAPNSSKVAPRRSITSPRRKQI